MVTKNLDKDNAPHKDKSTLSNEVPMTQREVDGAAAIQKQGGNPNKGPKADPTKTINS